MLLYRWLCSFTLALLLLYETVGLLLVPGIGSVVLIIEVWWLLLVLHLMVLLVKNAVVVQDGRLVVAGRQQRSLAERLGEDEETAVGEGTGSLGCNAGIPSIVVHRDRADDC